MEKWVPMIQAICNHYQPDRIIDYGCGKAVLSRHLPNVTNYDPAIHVYSAEPAPADMVVCSDVLEHIEPECLEDVLNHIESLARKVVFFTVSTIPANKTFPDGRNAHILVKPIEWWFPILMARWKLINASTFKLDRGFQVVMEKR